MAGALVVGGMPAGAHRVSLWMYSGSLSTGFANQAATSLWVTELRA
jgi:hypothetical protein